MKMKLIILSVFLTLTRCTNNTPAVTGNSSPPKPDSTHVKSLSKERENVLNNIVVEEKGGLQITGAYLTNESGTLINPDNTVPLGMPVYLTLQIKKGWVVEKGYVSPGAVQIITTNKGEPVLQSPDLFAGVERIKAADAARLQLKTMITVTRSDISYYVVRFRVWDKWGNGEAEGYYRLRIKK
jgi:hypothetical protein